jgi:hypothetical protein
VYNKGDASVPLTNPAKTTKKYVRHLEWVEAPAQFTQSNICKRRGCVERKGSTFFFFESGAPTFSFVTFADKRAEP